MIDKNKVNIYDIPIAMITEQYMEYVEQLKKEDLNVVSEFLVMAATLLDIKSRMLLPKEVDEEGNEEDPRAELVVSPITSVRSTGGVYAATASGILCFL